MNDAYEDALVTGWEPLVRGLEDLPDRGDAHVVAAALRGRADVIVTENVRDFPARVLEPLGLSAVRTDEFLMDQFDLSPTSTVALVQAQADAMSRPSVAIDVLLERLARSGATTFAATITAMLPATQTDEQASD